MARQGLQKRSGRYNRHIETEFWRFMKRLRRLQDRIYYGRHQDRLTSLEYAQFGSLLLKSIDLWKPGPGLEPLSETKRKFAKLKRIYFKICKILRKAGSRQPPKITTKVIVRKATQNRFLTTQIPETKK